MDKKRRFSVLDDANLPSGFIQAIYTWYVMLVRSKNRPVISCLYVAKTAVARANAENRLIPSLLDKNVHTRYIDVPTSTRYFITHTSRMYV